MFVRIKCQRDLNKIIYGRDLAKCQRDILIRPVLVKLSRVSDVSSILSKRAKLCKIPGIAI